VKKAAGSFSLVLAILAALLCIPAPAFALLNIAPDDTWGANDRVNAILEVGSTTFLGGSFTALEDDAGTLQTRNRLASVDASGNPTSFNPSLDGEVFNLAVSPDGSRLYVAGAFAKVGTQNRKRIAAFDLTTTPPSLSTWNPPSPNAAVRAVVVTADAAYIGGNFTNMGGVGRTRFAALSPTTGALLPWAPTADNLVRDMALAGGRMYAGGNFGVVNGAANNRLVSLDPDVTKANPPVLASYHPGYPVLDMEASGSQLFAAGGGGGGRALAVTSATGARQWEKKTDGNVQGVGVQGNRAFFGGHFFKYDGTAVTQIVSVDRNTGALFTDWLPYTNGFLGVFGIHGSGSMLYLGGDFDHAGVTGTAGHQPHFARFTDPNTSSANLGVTLTDAPDPVNLGSNLTYTAQVSNGGPDNATSVGLTDVLPASATFVSASAGCTYVGATSTVSCSLGSIANGATAPVSITAKPGTAGTLQNTVSVSGAQSDPAPGNNDATATTTVNSVGGADIHVTGSAPEPVNTSAGFAYTIQVLNQGPNTATAVTLSDVIPANAGFGSASTTQGSCSGSGPVNCSLGSITAGQAVTVTVNVTAPSSPMTLTNQATGSTSASDPDSADNVATTYTTVRTPSGDTSAPQRQSMEMRDQDGDGFVDRVVITFNETLAACPAPCTFGWVLSAVPSGGTLSSVSTSGTTVTLTIAEPPNPTPADADTSVGLFRVTLATPNGIQDAAGNHPSFSNVAPADKAGPTPIALNKTQAPGGTNGLAQSGDIVRVEWSEVISGSSFPATTTVTIADPAGSGNDQLTVAGLFTGTMDLGSDGYVTADGASASWPGSTVTLGPTSDAIVLKLGTSCSGGGCSSLGVVGAVTVTYVAPGSITDAAGNPANGSFIKTFTMF
jgi:uncharacterized repeat protein (TIGR01451 family)